jgi:hypothetical protein
VIKSFADRETQALYVTGRSRRLPSDIVARAFRKLEYVDLATRIEDLRVPPGTGCMHSKAIATASTRSRSTTSGASALASLTAMLTMSRSATTTDIEV